jgi:excisionase family DNA binding protein
MRHELEDTLSRGSLAESFLDPHGAAKYLGLSPITIKRMAREGVLPAHPIGEGKRRYWRFTLHELSAWLMSRSNQGARP